MPMFKLVRARPRDAKRVAHLLSNVSDEKPVKDVKRLIRERRVLVLKSNKKIKGAVSFTILGVLGFFAFMWVNKIAIDPEFRGQGMGTTLMILLKRYTLSMGVAGFMLYSLERAKNFYAKCSLSGAWRIFWWMN